MNKLLLWFLGWLFGFLFWGIVVYYFAIVGSLSGTINWVGVLQLFLLLGPWVGMFGAIIFDAIYMEKKRHK